MMKVIIGLLMSVVWAHSAFAEYDKTTLYMQSVKISMQHEQWLQAEKELLKVIQLDFKHVHARYLLGKMAEERGDLRLAKKRYKMTLFVDKKYRLALIGWARVAEKLNNSDMLVAYQRLLKLEPGNTSWNMKIAQYYLKHNPSKSKRYLNNVLRANPDHRQALELMIEYQDKHTLIAHSEIYQRRLDALKVSSGTKPSQFAQTKVIHTADVELPLQRINSPSEHNILSLSTLFSNSKLWVQHLTSTAETVLHRVVKQQHEQSTVPKLGKGSIKKDSVIFKQVIKQGDAQEQFMLGLMYHEGRGVVKNELRAVSLFKEAAMQGLGKAQLTLGLMLYQGDGIKKSEIAALRWFKRAAKKGVIDAQYALGLLYATSDRFKDERKAVKWWKSAALQNHVQAQHNLAIMYLEGRGVKKNHAQATRWFQQEARHDKPETS